MAAAPSMREAGKGGAIVIISSTLGLKVPVVTVPPRKAPTALPNMVPSA